MATSDGHDRYERDVDVQPVDVLVAADHQAIVGLLGALEAGLGDQRDELDRVVRELSRHIAAEEQLVYPRSVGEVAGAEDLVALCREDHHALQATLVHLERAERPSARARRRLGDLQAIVREHFREEDEVLLPALRRALGEEAMMELGGAFLRAKEAAPPRPHPDLPRPSNIVVGAIEGLIDRARDLVEGRRKL